METPLPLLPPLPGHSSDKLWVLAAHLSPFVGFPFIIPLIIYLAKRDSSAYIAENAREALNFHLFIFLLEIVSIILICFIIGIPLFFFVLLAAFILPIVAAIKSTEGNSIYRYPVTLRLI